MLMTSVGEPECLLNGIPGGLSQGRWARVSRNTHTWVKPRPAGIHRHAQPVTQAPPAGSLGWEPMASSSLGSCRGSREVGRSTGAWVRRHLGRERQQAHSSGESGDFFSRLGQGSHAALGPRLHFGFTAVIWSFSGCKGRAQRAARSRHAVEGEEAPAGQGGQRDQLQVQIPALELSDFGEESA